MNKEKFLEIVNKEKKNKKKRLLPLFIAFIVGGIMGVISQGLIDFANKILKLEMSESYAFSSIVIVLIVAILTFTSIYPKLGQLFGAGLFIPTSGFSNSMVSSSMEGKDEGLILGIGKTMFALAGSVIAYGVFSSVILCIIKYILVLLGVKLWT